VEPRRILTLRSNICAIYPQIGATIMPNSFWNSDTYQIVQAMKATGNATGIIQCWKETVARWAALNAGPDADAVNAWLPQWQVRPFYTAAELAPLWPVLAVTLGLCKRPRPPVSAARLANELKFVRLPFIVIDGKEYFIVEQIHRWSKTPPTQDELKEFFNAQR
jgi:hypothetical protein